ncbi:MAG: class I SAM-dependent methyltransferase [Lachnospiraceae bacterium]
MDSYTGFAKVYDEFMEDTTPYELWCSMLLDIIKEYGVSKPHKVQDEVSTLESERDLVLDLGCGTGTLTGLLAEEGYDMIGVDLSSEMLELAISKKEASGHNIMYLCQDMRELELYSTVGTILCVCDSINYVLEDEEVIETFRLVHNYLYPKGLFLFDFNTEYKYREVIGDTVIAENHDDASFIWENYYDEDTCINEYDITIFSRTDESGELFERVQETHIQRGYTLEEMKCFVEAAGMELIKVFDADTHGVVTEVTQRVFVVARENGKSYE